MLKNWRLGWNLLAFASCFWYAAFQILNGRERAKKVCLWNGTCNFETCGRACGGVEDPRRTQQWVGDLGRIEDPHRTIMLRRRIHSTQESNPFTAKDR